MRLSFLCLGGIAAFLAQPAFACSTMAESRERELSDLVIEGSATCDFEAAICNIRIDRDLKVGHTLSGKLPLKPSLRGRNVTVYADNGHLMSLLKEGIMICQSFEPDYDAFYGRFYLVDDRDGKHLRVRRYFVKDADGKFYENGIKCSPQNVTDENVASLQTCNSVDVK